MKHSCKHYSIRKLLTFVSEAQQAHQSWRQQSWEDYEFRDGQQWTASDTARMVDKGINPLTINRIFPIMNLIDGHFINNQQDIVAKGRTKQDNELGQVMSEGIQYAADQNSGPQKTGEAFKDQITAGFGCLSTGYNSDPRREKVKISLNPWYSMWWDPYGTPWLDTESCRYVFKAEWKDLDSLAAVFPEKKADLKDQFSRLTTDYFVPEVYDEGTQIEDYKQFLSSANWANKDRKRVRPIEMWYTKLERAWFAKMPNGRVINLDKAGDEVQQFSIIQQATEVVSAVVKKMRVATFLSDLLLQDCETPYPHDEFPFIPYVGYVDRFGYPFGVPRQIKEQDMEVNKRRSMSLSLLSNRRVIVEDGAAEDLNKTYAEANRQDGFIVLKKGKKNAFEIQEMASLAAPQLDLLRQSEAEMKEISGANDESLGYKTGASQSGVAIDKKQQSTATMIASLLQNARYSQKRLGEQVMSLIQDTWTEEKVLRITDRVTGVEKFIEVNQPLVGPDGEVEIHNNITQGRFDIVIAAKPLTDTMREKNMELLFSAINKSPAEAVGPLLNLALEISDIPNKDILLRQVREATGVGYIDDNLSTDEREQQEKAAQDQKTAEEQQAKQQAIEDQLVKREAEKAKTNKLNAEAEKIRSEIGAANQLANAKSYEVGQKTALALLKGGQDGKRPSAQVGP